MKRKFLICFLLLLASVNISFAQADLQKDTMYLRCTNALDFATQQAKRMISNLPKDGNKLPRSIDTLGVVSMVDASDWTSGFFSGELWYLASYKNDSLMLVEANKYTQLLFPQQFMTNTHDLGFMMYCSYGTGLKLANPKGYKDVLIQTAQSLQTRYSEKVGCICSWDFGTWSYPVIIDNMINLELLAWATKVTGDSTYVKSAISHAMNTLTNHYRKDYSCYHLVDYDLATGEVRGKQTFQGYDDASSWARGQAWGLYGFTMMYNETKEDAFLVQAKHIANYIFNNTPTDYIPFWDYNDPAIQFGSAPRDASAAAVTASTLLELYRLTNNDSYLKFAEKILWNLSSPKYMNAANENNNFLLKHSTGHKPHNSEIDVPIIYADYYFVEALYRYVKLRNVGIALL